MLFFKRILSVLLVTMIFWGHVTYSQIYQQIVPDPSFEGFQFGSNFTSWRNYGSGEMRVFFRRGIHPITGFPFDYSESSTGLDPRLFHSSTSRCNTTHVADPPWDGIPNELRNFNSDKENIWGNIRPRHGENYAGIFSYIPILTSSHKNQGGMSIELNKNLDYGKNYILKFSLAKTPSFNGILTDAPKIEVILAKSRIGAGEQRPSLIRNGLIKSTAKKTEEWENKEFRFRVNRSDYRFLFIKTKGLGCKRIWIDNVELFEEVHCQSQCCKTDVYFQNRDFDYAFDGEHASNRIVSGFDVTDSEENGYVTVSSSNPVIWTAGNEIIMEPGTEIKRGSNFETRLLNCSPPHPTTPMVINIEKYKTPCAIGFCSNICSGGSGFYEFKWFINNQLVSNDQSFESGQNGPYKITLRVKDLITDLVYEKNETINTNFINGILYHGPIPNIVTANGDGLNDEWFILDPRNIDERAYNASWWSLEIYDRNGGNVLYSMNNVATSHLGFENGDISWDATYNNGNQVVPGTYFARLQFGSCTHVATFNFWIQVFTGSSNRAAIIPLRFENSNVGYPIPNPANTTCRLPLNLAEPGKVTAYISNAMGMRVAMVWEGKPMPTGEHSISMPIENLEPGVYYITVQHEGFKQARRFVVVR